MAKYVQEYLDLLAKPENLEKTADLIESIKKASVVGWDGNAFSEYATNDILEKLYRLVPSAIETNTNTASRKFHRDKGQK